jgi:hypothetical protein
MDPFQGQDWLRATVEVKHTGRPKRQMQWKVFSGAQSVRLLIGFMSRLVHRLQKRIFLILNNLRAHHSKSVKK